MRQLKSGCRHQAHLLPRATPQYHRTCLARAAPAPSSASTEEAAQQLQQQQEQQQQQRQTSGGSASTSEPLHQQRPVPRLQLSKSAQPSKQSGGLEFLHLSLDLPPPVNSRVKQACFVKSSATVADCPPDRLPEFALIGRSNVGKSSLINCLTEQDGLARVSRKPGMTKLINHYLVNESWYLVDLPGYGFSKTASQAVRESWLKFTKDFFINRNNLVHVLLLVDSSLPPQQIDLECACWLAECEVPFAVVFTKMDVTRKKKDKLPSSAMNVRSFKTAMAKDWRELPWCFETSSKNGSGRSELLAYLASLRDLHLACCK